MAVLTKNQLHIMETSEITDSKNIFDDVLTVIQKTNDGANLSPKDLHLTECAINGFLTEEGIAEFYSVYHRVIDGTYDKLKNYLFGVEHITKDHECYVYYKGKHIDHFTFNGDYKGERQAAIKAAKICSLLESKNIEVSPLTYCWKVEDYLTAEELATIEEPMGAYAD